LHRVPIVLGKPLGQRPDQVSVSIQP
jgi:hypothetical protein